MAEDAGVPITNTLFPPPPPYYEAYTEANLERYASLSGPSSSSSHQGKAGRERNEQKGEGEGEAMTIDLSEEEKGVLESLRGKLEKPRVDWIEEDGRWMAFGQMYSTKPLIPTAQTIGLPPLFPPETRPQDTLPTLLGSFLHTLLLLLDTLTNTARTPDELMAAGWAHEGDQYIQHLTNLAAHMMVSSNQLRGVQSEATLVLMMEKELEERRRQTGEMQRRCKEIAGNIRALRAARGVDNPSQAI